MSVTTALHLRQSRLEVLEGDELEDIRPEWVSLWRDDPCAPPFLAPAWLMPWARHYAPGRCRLVCARSGGRLVALLPVFGWEGKLLLAGTGPSDYGGGLFRSGCERVAGSLLRAACESAGDDIHAVDLQQLQLRSPLLAAPAPPGWSETREDGETCPLLRLEGEGGMDLVPRRWCKNWRYYCRRIERERGTVELVPDEEVPASLQELQRLHARRWAVRGEGGMFADGLLRRFLEDAVPELSADGLLRMHRLSLGGRSAGVLMAFHGHGRAHYYLSGFDPDYSALSPGMVLVGSAIARAAQEGATEFHFLRGREEYKYRWGALDRETCRRILSRVRTTPAG